jgi:hypothetical protein
MPSTRLTNRYEIAARSLGGPVQRTCGSCAVRLMLRDDIFAAVRSALALIRLELAQSCHFIPGVSRLVPRIGQAFALVGDEVMPFECPRQLRIFQRIPLRCCALTIRGGKRAILEQGCPIDHGASTFLFSQCAVDAGLGAQQLVARRFHRHVETCHSPIGAAFILVCEPLALVGKLVPLVGEPLALVRKSLALIGGVVPLNDPARTMLIVHRVSH